MHKYILIRMHVLPCTQSNTAYVSLSNSYSHIIYVYCIAQNFEGGNIDGFGAQLAI